MAKKRGSKGASQRRARKVQKRRQRQSRQRSGETTPPRGPQLDVDSLDGLQGPLLSEDAAMEIIGDSAWLAEEPELARSSIREEDVAKAIRALEGAALRLEAEGEQEPAAEAEIVREFLAKPESQAGWHAVGVIREILLNSLRDGLGIVEPDGGDPVAATMEILRDLGDSLSEADLVLGLFEDEELLAAAQRVDRALTDRGLPLIGTEEERELEP
jgi:hypothetical protein